MAKAKHRGGRVLVADTLERMPRRLSSQTKAAVGRVWHALQTTVASSPLLKDMPRFVTGVGAAIWSTSADDVMRAMQSGDVPFFVAMMLRLDLLNDGLVRAGRSLGDRSVIINAKWVVEGFRIVAEQNLRKLGGVWPPGSDWEEEVSEPERDRSPASARPT